MKSPPLDSTHGRTTSGMAFHHRLWAAHTVKRRWAWHDITAFGQHSRSATSAWHDTTALGQRTRYDYVVTSPPSDSTHNWQRRAWHDITALGQHTRSNDIGCGKPSSPLGSTHGRMTSGVACHHSPWMTNTIKQRWAWHAITAFG